MFPDISLMDGWFGVNSKQEPGGVHMFKEISLGNRTAIFAFCWLTVVSRFNWRLNL